MNPEFSLILHITAVSDLIFINLSQSEFIHDSPKVCVHAFSFVCLKHQFLQPEPLKTLDTLLYFKIPLIRLDRYKPKISDYIYFFA